MDQVLQRPAVDGLAVLNALSEAVVVLDSGDHISYVNPATEQMLGMSDSVLVGAPLSSLVPEDHPLASLIRQVRGLGRSMSEHGVYLESPRFASTVVSINVAPLFADDGSWPTGQLAISIVAGSIAQKIDQQLIHRNAARSIAGMAAVLAHEVKNPLAGIRGAAQLIEPSVSEGDQELTRLICDETDRICALVDRMGLFAEQRVDERHAVNIHEVLERARKIAQASFGRQVRFSELYDPSLPPVFGDRDELVQVMLNLIKNACDACPSGAGEIVLRTGYRHGVRLAVSGGARPVDLPIMVSVQDNGPGIPEDLRDHLFDAFVTTKPDGVGLGLALVAKIIGGHGGVIEFDSEPKRTVFTMMLPMADEPEST